MAEKKVKGAARVKGPASEGVGVGDLPLDLRAFDSGSEEDTQLYGRRLAGMLPVPAVVILTGELGAGKTTLIKGLAVGLGVAAEEDVTSPSYTLIHEYVSPRVALYHVDLYRLEGEPALATLGLEDILPGGGRQSGVVAIEWGAKFPILQQLRHLAVTLEHAGAQRRRIRAAWVETH